MGGGPRRAVLWHVYCELHYTVEAYNYRCYHVCEIIYLISYFIYYTL